MRNTLIAILSILIVFSAAGGFFYWITKENPSDLSQGNYFSPSEVSFLESSGFLSPAVSATADKGNAKISRSDLKSPDLVEQKLDSSEERFEILATKLDFSSSGYTYQMVFNLENKTSQPKEFYLIPVSEKSQLQFQEIKGVINNEKALSINKDNVLKEPLASLYNIEQHKKELTPKLAEAYNDIEKNNYEAKPIKVILDANSTLLAKSKWEIKGSNSAGTSPAGVAGNAPAELNEGRKGGLKPVYFLVYGSAGGVKDELTILNVHSSPRQGENWEVSFTARDIADLKIIPNDQATIDDDEFVSLTCDSEERTPQILAGDVIYYPNWECSGTGKVVHYTKKAGKHTLRFEFGGQIAFAYNTSASAVLSIKGGFKLKSGLKLKF